MKKTVLTIIGFFILGLCAGQDQNFLERPYLETVATYTSDVTPDEIYLFIQLNESDTRGKTPIEELERIMIARLTSIGIDTKKQLKVLDATSDFKTYLLKKKDILKNKDYRLLVYDANMMGKVFQVLEAANISNINLERVSLSNIEEFKIELKGKAVEKAKKQAVSMLESVEGEIGKVLFVSDLDTQIIDSRDFRGANSFYGLLSEIDMSTPDIEKIRVQSKVRVYFEIH